MTTHPDIDQQVTTRRAGSNGAPPTVPSMRPMGGRDRARVPRRYGQWAAAMLFVLVTMLAAGWLWQSRSDRVEVLAVRDAVPAGAVISRSDLRTVQVAGVAGAVRVGDLDAVVGRTAVVGLVPGQVLNPAMVTVSPVPGRGQRVLGVEVDATRTPGGLVPGDVVSVVAVPPSGDAGTPRDLESPRILAEVATVRSMSVVEGSGTRLSLVLPAALAGRVAAFGAAGRVAVIQAPVGGDG